MKNSILLTLLLFLVSINVAEARTVTITLKNKCHLNNTDWVIYLNKPPQLTPPPEKVLNAEGKAVFNNSPNEQLLAVPGFTRGWREICNSHFPKIGLSDNANCTNNLQRLYATMPDSNALTIPASEDDFIGEIEVHCGF